MAKILDKIMSMMKLDDRMEDEIDMENEDKYEDISSAQNIRPAKRENKSPAESYDRPTRSSSQSKSTVTAYSPRSSSAQAVAYPKTNVVNFHASVQMEVVVIQPATYDEAQVIADHIRGQKPVIVNLEKMDYSIAQRIMDFVSGAVYTLGGNLERVTQNIFIIAPENVDIAGHFQEELKSNGIILPWKSE